jgi:transposase
MVSSSTTPDPEVAAKATRRRFSAAEKARILDAYEAASEIERAAICRRERIYSTLLYNWRKQRATGMPLSARRGPKPNPEATEITRLQKRNAALEQQLAKAQQVIDIQGKVYALLRACAGESADQLDLPPWQPRSAK